MNAYKIKSFLTNLFFKKYGEKVFIFRTWLRWKGF